MKPKNINLYNQAKEIIFNRYKKNSAYRSGAIIKLYKSMGGTFEDDNKEKPLKRWFKERWQDVSIIKGYPVYRPTKKISNKTPLTINEIDKKNLIEQSIIKQIIKGDKNLKPFKRKK